MREKIAELEHEQWISWSKYLASNYKLPSNLLDKWSVNWITYSKLSEEMKDKDRVWADKVLNIVKDKINRINIEIHKDIVFCGEEGPTINHYIDQFHKALIKSLEEKK